MIMLWVCVGVFGNIKYMLFSVSSSDFRSQEYYSSPPSRGSLLHR